MRRHNNKALYEKIMRNVSKEVKRTLNESIGSTYYILYFVSYIDDEGIPTLRIENIHTTPEEGINYFLSLSNTFNDNVLYDNVNNFYYCHEDEFENYQFDDGSYDEGISVFTDDNGNKMGKVEIAHINNINGEDWLDTYDSHSIYVLDKFQTK